jgi:hypothetical protein
MPAPVIKSFAPTFARRNEMSESVALETLERLWERAKQIAKRRFEDEGEEYWSYVMGIWKKMVKYEQTEAVSSASHLTMLRIVVQM